MLTTDLETAIADFLALGRQLQQVQSLTGERILSELVTWYRDNRIESAIIDADADMLLLQWGATRPLIVPEPTDLRGCDDDNLKFTDQKVRYLNFTRQVFASENDDDEFDDLAVQMSITLGFGLADKSEKSSNLWIHTPDDVDSGIAKFRNMPFVQSLLFITAQSVAITVGNCG